MTESPIEQPVARKRRFRVWGCLFRILGLALVLLLLAFIAASVGAYLGYKYVTEPGVPGALVTVEIPEGATGREAGRILADSGLIEHELAFRAAIRLSKESGTVKHGTYNLPLGLSPTEYLHALYEGSSVFSPDAQGRITIPEGLSLRQMADCFDDPASFVEAASNVELLKSLGVDAPTLEGFLMPNTYFFDEEPTPKEAVQRMVEQFRTEYEAIMTEQPDRRDEDIVRIVTVASLVEEEARVDEERPLVAAVIYNRLEKKMPLDLDSTLQYALDKYGQRMLHEDKEVDSPYNTYKNPGLPPGPISNPGVASIRAALNPADVQYLYFVSNADGETHSFSNTLAEHERAVARYRSEMRQQRRALRNQ